MNLKHRILAFLSSEETSTEETVVELSDMELEDGTTITSEDWSEGGAIFIKGEGEEAENVKLPEGIYQIDGKTLVIEQEGVIKSWGETEAKEDEATDEPKEEVKEELAEEPQDEPKDESNEPEVDGQIQELIIVIGALEARIAKLEGSEELAAEVAEEVITEEVITEEVQLSNDESKEDESEPIVHIPEDKKAEKKSAFYFGKQ